MAKSVHSNADCRNPARLSVIKSVSALSPLNERWLSDACIRAALGSPPRQKSIQVFRNPILDRWLGRTHPALPALLFGPLIVVALVYARGRVAGQEFAGAFLGGLLGFTLLEYVLHRFVLHRPVGPARASRIAAFLRHGYHHAYPSDKGRLVLPPLVTIPFAVAIAVPAVLLLPFGEAAAAFAGTAAGYVTYDSTHWWLHHARPKWRVGRFLKRYHLLHHHHPSTGRFGVSTPLWDLVFGTYAPTRLPLADRKHRTSPLERTSSEPPTEASCTGPAARLESTGPVELPHRQLTQRSFGSSRESRARSRAELCPTRPPTRLT